MMIPAETYDRWRGDYELLNPVRLPLDDAIASAVAAVLDEPLATWQALRAGLTVDQFYTLLTFARRAAVFAMRDRNPRHLRDALFAVALIEPDRIDRRDLWQTSLLRYTADRIGADPELLFAEAAAKAEPAVAQALAAVMRQPSPDLQSCGYDEISTSHGVGLIDRWGDPYEPTLNLARVAVDITGLINADGVYMARPTLGSNLPPFWIEQANPDRVSALLRQVRAGAAIHADRRPDGTELQPSVRGSMSDHGLLVFIVELPAVEEAKALLDLARSAGPYHSCQLPVSRGPLFTLLIARPWIVDLAPIETAETLARLVPGIEAVMERYSAV